MQRITELSIIIPTLNEAAGISSILSRLAGCRSQQVEIIVVDGGSDDGTASIAAGLVDAVIASRRGRAHQLNAGARAARGAWLCFLHADTTLPCDALEHIRCALGTCGAQWGRFDVRLDAPALIFRLIEAAINLRSRCTAIATGDQAIFMTRDIFERVGGFPAIALMEDVAMCQRLRRLQRPVCLRSTVTTSARRWLEHGILKTVLLMWWLRLAYACGVSPQRLAQWYRVHR